MNDEFNKHPGAALLNPINSAGGKNSYSGSCTNHKLRFTENQTLSKLITTLNRSLSALCYSVDTLAISGFQGSFCKIKHIQEECI